MVDRVVSSISTSTLCLGVSPAVRVYPPKYTLQYIVLYSLTLSTIVLCYFLIIWCSHRLRSKFDYHDYAEKRKAEGVGVGFSFGYSYSGIEVSK